MIQFKIEDRRAGCRKYTYINEECGHKQEFNYIAPFMCQTQGCRKHLHRIDTLFGAHNVKNRIKYCVHGTIGDV